MADVLDMEPYEREYMKNRILDDMKKEEAMYQKQGL